MTDIIFDFLLEQKDNLRQGIFSYFLTLVTSVVVFEVRITKIYISVSLLQL